MRVIVARSGAGAGAFAEALAGHGIACVFAPVLDIAARPDPALDGALAGAQAVLLTSANGARALAAGTARRAFAIAAAGDATAAAARRLGFADVRSVDGDSAALAAFAAARFDPAAGPLLHVGGKHVAGDMETALKRRGFACERRVLYEAIVARALPDVAAAALRGGTADAAALFSPRGAAAFAALARAAGLEDRLARLDAFCLSLAVAEAAEGARWRRVFVAGRPRADSLRARLLAARCGGGA